MKTAESPLTVRACLDLLSEARLEDLRRRFGVKAPQGASRLDLVESLATSGRLPKTPTAILEALPYDELMSICQARGVPVTGVATGRLVDLLVADPAAVEKERAAEHREAFEHLPPEMKARIREEERRRAEADAEQARRFARRVWRTAALVVAGNFLLAMLCLAGFLQPLVLGCSGGACAFAVCRLELNRFLGGVLFLVQAVIVTLVMGLSGGPGVFGFWLLELLLGWGLGMREELRSE